MVRCSTTYVHDQFAFVLYLNRVLQINGQQTHVVLPKLALFFARSLCKLSNAHSEGPSVVRMTHKGFCFNSVFVLYPTLSECFFGSFVHLCDTDLQRTVFPCEPNDTLDVVVHGEFTQPIQIHDVEGQSDVLWCQSVVMICR